MKIEGDTLVIYEPIVEDNLEEFKVALNQPQIKHILIENVDLIAPAIQVLWCLDKDVRANDELLNRLFENVQKE